MLGLGLKQLSKAGSDDAFNREVQENRKEDLPLAVDDRSIKVAIPGSPTGILMTGEVSWKDPKLERCQTFFCTTKKTRLNLSGRGGHRKRANHFRRDGENWRSRFRGE